MNEAAFRELISGGKRGLGASLARSGLSVASLFYGGAVCARNFAFDCGCRRIHAAPVPVVSVGNITTGGTGKTPFVAWLAEWFRQAEIRAGLLSRGYRALAGQVNDEKLVLDLLCAGIPHVQNPDRVAGARTLCREHGCQVIVLDDGFQHRRLARQLDIVLIDALNPWGYRRLLPRGLLREPLSSLQRAGLVVLTRADLVGEEQRRGILDEIALHTAIERPIETAFQPLRLVNVEGKPTPIDELRGRRVLAFCGIGNPESFRETLERAGMEVAELRTFPDHHHYTPADLQTLAGEVQRANVAAVVTTQKDLVKIEGTRLAEVPLWSVEIGTVILSGGDLLESKLDEVAQLV